MHRHAFHLGHEQLTGSAPGAPQITGSPAPESGCALYECGECSVCGLCVEMQADAVETLVTSGAARVGSAMGARPRSLEIAGLIDHTLLKPDATESDVRRLWQRGYVAADEEELIERVTRAVLQSLENQGRGGLTSRPGSSWPG